MLKCMGLLFSSHLAHFLEKCLQKDMRGDNGDDTIAKTWPFSLHQSQFWNGQMLINVNLKNNNIVKKKLLSTQYFQVLNLLTHLLKLFKAPACATLSVVVPMDASLANFCCIPTPIFVDLYMAGGGFLLFVWCHQWTRCLTSHESLLLNIHPKKLAIEHSTQVRQQWKEGRIRWVKQGKKIKSTYSYLRAVWWNRRKRDCKFHMVHVAILQKPGNIEFCWKACI